MKYLLFLFLLASCSKNDDQAQPLVQPTVKLASITKVDFYPVYAGSNESVAFKVQLVADSSIVTRVALYRSPQRLAWEVKKPTTGTVMMYDHLGDYPGFNANAMYYFTFYYKDGTESSTKPFQVY